MRIPMFKAFLATALLFAGCPIDIEGNEPGECSDDADNDSDGLFDCDDPDCAGASVCDGADDDAGDDDAGDDDAADDDAGDDDAGADDASDDDASDDDASDDDASDDDVSDDDSGDDDTSIIPVVPSMVFTVPSGSLAGNHVYDDLVECGLELDFVGWRIIGHEGGAMMDLRLWTVTQIPPGTHEDVDFGVIWSAPPWSGSRMNGGADCFIDIVGGHPSHAGTFQCASVMMSDGGPDEAVDIVDGAFLCP